MQQTRNSQITHCLLMLVTTKSCPMRTFDDLMATFGILNVKIEGEMVNKGFLCSAFLMFMTAHNAL